MGGRRIPEVRFQGKRTSIERVREQRAIEQRQKEILATIRATEERGCTWIKVQQIHGLHRDRAKHELECLINRGLVAMSYAGFATSKRTALGVEKLGHPLQRSGGGDALFVAVEFLERAREHVKALICSVEGCGRRVTVPHAHCLTHHHAAKLPPLA
jgi:hypothetical protein